MKHYLFPYIIQSVRHPPSPKLGLLPVRKHSGNWGNTQQQRKQVKKRNRDIFLSLVTIIDSCVHSTNTTASIVQTERYDLGWCLTVQE